MENTYKQNTFSLLCLCNPTYFVRGNSYTCTVNFFQTFPLVLEERMRMRVSFTSRSLHRKRSFNELRKCEPWVKSPPPLKKPTSFQICMYDRAFKGRLNTDTSPRNVWTTFLDNGSTENFKKSAVASAIAIPLPLCFSCFVPLRRFRENLTESFYFYLSRTCDSQRYSVGN